MNIERKKDSAAESISLLMKMANLIDDNIMENPECLDVSISSRAVGYGYRAWSFRLREMILLINELKAENYELLERAKYLNCDLQERPNLEELTDEHQKEIWEHYRRLLKEERAEGYAT